MVVAIGACVVGEEDVVAEVEDSDADCRVDALESLTVGTVSEPCLSYNPAPDAFTEQATVAKITKIACPTEFMASVYKVKKSCVLASKTVVSPF